MVWSLLLWMSWGWAGPAPELPAVLQQSASWRALRVVEGAPVIPADEYARVAKGEVITGLRSVEGVPAKKSYGVAVIDAPIDRLWGAINDESLHAQYTSLDYAELVKGAPCQSGRHVFQYLPSGVPMVENRWWVTVRDTNAGISARSGGKARELVWHNTPDGSEVTSAAGRSYMSQGVMVGFTKGSWFLLAVNDHQTLVEYYTWVDPGGNLSPAVMSWFATKTIVKTFENMTALSRDTRLKCTS